MFASSHHVKIVKTSVSLLQNVHPKLLLCDHQASGSNSRSTALGLCMDDSCASKACKASMLMRIDANLARNWLLGVMQGIHSNTVVLSEADPAFCTHYVMIVEYNVVMQS